MPVIEEEAYKQVLSLVALFRQHGLDELLVDDGSFKLRLSRTPSKPQPAPPARPQPREAERQGKGRTVAVRSPLIGVFYRAAAPDTPTFVEIGDVVKEGQTVCIVEAMKVFNEIHAEWNGRVVAIPAENGKLVQTGDPLVVLEFLNAAEAEKEG